MGRAQGGGRGPPVALRISGRVACAGRDRDRPREPRAGAAEEHRPLLSRPRVARRSVAFERGDPRLAEMGGRELVQLGQPRGDQPVVEPAPEWLLGGDQLLERPSVERVGVGEDVAQIEEEANRAPSRIAQPASQGRKPPQRELRCGRERVRVQDANERHVHHEPLDPELVRCEGLMLQVAGDDAGVVSAIPGRRRRSGDESEPQTDVA